MALPYSKLFGGSIPLGAVKSSSATQKREIVNFLNSPEGSAFKPAFGRYLNSLNEYFKYPNNKFNKHQADIAVYKFNQAKENFVGYVKDNIDNLYLSYVNLAKEDKNFKNSATTEAKKIMKAHLNI